MGVVPVPEALRRLSVDPDFWTALLTDEPVAPLTDDGVTDIATLGVPAELRISFPVAGGYGLVLDLDLSRRERTLGLRRPAAAEPVQLGWAAPDRPPAAALRFGELELFARVIALEDPLLPHPGLVVALLSGFAPEGPEDDPAEVHAVLEAAYRSLRRDVPPAGPGGPEQAPLPFFDDAAWWPLPPAQSAQVLDEGTIATLLTAGSAGPDVRGTSRFPTHDLTEAVRQARTRLSRLPHEPWFDDAVLPLAWRIAASGDLGPVSELLGTLTESGCDHPTVLDALSEPMIAVEACWMVEALAGVEQGTLLRRHLVGGPRLG
jgi:hypothetical protein